MTVSNLLASIDAALAERPDEPTVRISKREAESIVSSAELGAGPDPLLESLYVTSFVLGPEVARSLVADLGTEVPVFGTRDRDFVVDDAATKVFDAFFRKHRVPVGGARDAIAAEMKEQLLNLGKGRAAPTGTFYRVDLTDHRGDTYIGRVDAKAGTFFIEAPAAGRRGESVFYGAFRLDGRADPPRR